MNQSSSGQLVELVGVDCGLVNAVNLNGRFFVAYQTRPDGHIHLKEDVNNRLVDVPEPYLSHLLTAAAVQGTNVAPQFDLPGPKQGSVSMVANGPELRVYYTGRADGDPTGPFRLWKLTFQP